LAYDIYLFTLCYSALLSLLGIALTLRHRASNIPDFSIITYSGLGICITAFSTSILHLNIYTSPFIALTIGCIAGAIHYRFIMRRMEKRGDDIILRTLSTIGVQILLIGLLNVAAYWYSIMLPELQGLFHLLDRWDFALWGIQGIYIVIPLTCIILWAMLSVLFRGSLGATLTASGENPELAMVQGVNPWRVKLLIWSLSGGLACVAGSLFPPFYHIDPGSLGLLIPVMAVGVLGGFDSLLMALVAAFFVGMSEILGIIWLEFNVGNFLGEYRLMIPIAILYFSMLLIPRGLVELKEFLVFDRRWLSGKEIRRLLGLATLCLVVVGFVVVADNHRINVLESETMGWINVSNRIGQVGAKMYSDSYSPNLLESQQFSVIYPPANISTVESLENFAGIIHSRGVGIVYRHGDVLIIVIDPSLGYSYDPHLDNFGLN
jgi:branched-chain amino acid transport system permease protein